MMVTYKPDIKPLCTCLTCSLLACPVHRQESADVERIAKRAAELVLEALRAKP